MKATSTSSQTIDLLLGALRGTPGRSRRELAEATGLSLATVARLVSQLIKDGVLQESGPNLTGGRPSTEVSLTPDAATVLAVDVADHHTEIALVGWDGAVLATRTHVTGTMAPPDRLAHTRTMTAQALAEHRTRAAVVAVGVSIPGPVHHSGMVEFAPALHWQQVPLGPMLAEDLGLPVAVHNDANLIAVAETHHGIRRGSGSLFALAVYGGVGAGIVIDGRVWNGHGGYAGQIGRMLLEVQSLSAEFPEFGGLETQLGSVGITRRAESLGIPIDPDREIFEQLFAPEAADPRRAELAEAVLDQFALSLVNVCALLDPATIVLAGRFAPLAEQVAPRLRQRLDGRVLRVPELIGESTAHTGTILGAARLAFDSAGSLSEIVAGLAVTET